MRERRPDLVVDGPLQYDAAAIASVAHSKAPDSPVAGRATVFVFPDLNTGNTTYKAVQRSADVVSVGPMLQGVARPVNDLSRGALVDDIVYTIALTAIQAAQVRPVPAAGEGQRDSSSQRRAVTAADTSSEPRQPIRLENRKNMATRLPPQAGAHALQRPRQVAGAAECCRAGRWPWSSVTACTRLSMTAARDIRARNPTSAPTAHGPRFSRSS